jgi:hypothetical protein
MEVNTTTASLGFGVNFVSLFWLEQATKLTAKNAIISQTNHNRFVILWQVYSIPAVLNRMCLYHLQLISCPEKIAS